MSQERELYGLFREIGLSEAGAKVAAAERSLYWLRPPAPEGEIDFEAADEWAQTYADPIGALERRFKELGLSDDAARIAAQRGG